MERDELTWRGRGEEARRRSSAAWRSLLPPRTPSPYTGASVHTAVYTQCIPYAHTTTHTVHDVPTSTAMHYGSLSRQLNFDPLLLPLHYGPLLPDFVAAVPRPTSTLLYRGLDAAAAAAAAAAHLCLEAAVETDDEGIVSEGEDVSLGKHLLHLVT